MDSSTSWVVALGCCWTNLFILAIFRSAAIVYVAILNSLDTTRAEAAWPLTVMAILSCIPGPVVGWLATHVAVWKMTVTACAIGALSISACFFANGIWFLVISLGIVHGISASFIILCNTVIRAHFTRYRALACGISYAGLTISGLIFPPLLQFLFDKYGPNGMFLITGALMLNAIAGGLLQRLPPEEPSKPDAVLDEFKMQEMALDGRCSDEIGIRKRADDSTGRVLSPQSKSFMTKDDRLRYNKTTHAVDDPPDVQAVVFSDPRTTEDGGCWKQTERPSKERAHGDVSNAHDKVSTYCVSATIRSKVTLPTYLGLSRFYIVALADSVVLFNICTYGTVVVDFAADRKVSKWNAVLVLTIYAIADLISRLVSGWITDRRFLSKGSMMAVHLFLWAASFCLMPLCYSFYSHAIQAVVVGWCNGATLILTPVLLMELVDSDKFSECFGVKTLISGIMLLPRALLIGYFRDSLGDYQGLFILMGVVTALSGFSCLFLRGNLPRKPILYKKVTT
ncbi:unnamed protein product [Ixodes hexagonus]